MNAHVSDAILHGCSEPPSTWLLIVDGEEEQQAFPTDAQSHFLCTFCILPL